MATFVDQFMTQKKTIEIAHMKKFIDFVRIGQALDTKDGVGARVFRTVGYGKFSEWDPFLLLVLFSVIHFRK